MTRADAYKQAAESSQTEGTAKFVVFIYDEGYAVYDAEQIEAYAAMLEINAVFRDGAEDEG
jgi:hypothetical protein